MEVDRGNQDQRCNEVISRNPRVLVASFESAFREFGAFSAALKIYKLRVFSEILRFNPVPGHHIPVIINLMGRAHAFARGAVVSPAALRKVGVGGSIPSLSTTL